MSNMPCCFPECPIAVLRWFLAFSGAVFAMCRMGVSNIDTTTSEDENFPNEMERDDTDSTTPSEADYTFEPAFHSTPDTSDPPFSGANSTISMDSPPTRDSGFQELPGAAGHAISD